MPLHCIKSISESLKVVVWQLTETHLDLEKEVKLGKEEKEAYDLISLPVKKREFLAGKFVLEKGCNLLKIPFLGVEKDVFGKPHLVGKPCEISISHTVDFVAAVFSFNRAVGIDLEAPRAQILKILPRLFSEKELEYVANDLEKATIFWSIKEALYKLYGKRKVDFKENLLIESNDENLVGYIKMPDQDSRHCIFIEKIEKYFLIIAH